MKVAILEDDPACADFERGVLAAGGHDCEVYAQGHALVHALRQKTFDLLMLDWDVPDMPGTAVLRWVRHHLPGHIPVLFVTCHSQGADIEAMLNAGADDYVVKPVTTGVLNARVNALLWRAWRLSSSGQDSAVFGDVRFDLRERQVYRSGQLIGLTVREFNLALLLFHRMGQLVARERALATMQAVDPQMPAHLLDTHV